MARTSARSEARRRQADLRAGRADRIILRQVSQRHATIFAREIGINLTPTQWAALSKLLEVWAVLAEPARAADLDGRSDHQGRDRPLDRARIDRDRPRSRRRPPPDGQPDARSGQQIAEKAATNALVISKETLAPLDAKERDTLIALLGKIAVIQKSNTVTLRRSRSDRLEGRRPGCPPRL